MVIADLSFPSRVELDALRAALADELEEEHFWVADEAIAAMNAAGPRPCVTRDHPVYPAFIL
jgi:hypothetical protein